VISTARGLVKNKPQVEVKTAIEPNLPSLSGDKRRLRQVFLNLVANAVKFTPRGVVSITVKRENGDIHFTVSDTGVGIAPEDRDVIFESFRQGSHGLSGPGTGLGLPISKHFVEAHAGKIWFESEAGAGATFHVTLPIHVQNRVETLSL
jgi:signal transduction histidine kinase